MPSSKWMDQALRLAKSAGNDCAPNPRVGCVLVGVDGSVIGQGFTQKVGGPHAEVMALREAATNGFSTIGATAYVTLEPCSHQGRTGPCCDALIAAGVKKVVASIEDPNPVVSGNGFNRLRAAGLDVLVGPGALESRELNVGFFNRMIHKKPWVRMKIAASIDGYTALQNGSSQWITSEAARADGHAWRARAGAILSGIGTVLADNPRLDVRMVATEAQPPAVIVDSRLETPLDAHLYIADRAVFIYTAIQNDEKKAALEAIGATVIYCPDDRHATENRVDLHAMLQDLATREINELHVEAGSKLNGALLQAGLVDEIVIYLAPKFLGSGQGMASLDILSNLNAAILLEFRSIDFIGPDIRILARPEGKRI